MQLHAGHHKVVEFGGLAFNMDTLYMTWLTAAIVIIITMLATRKRELVPSGIQNVVESIFEVLMAQMKPALGDKMHQVISVLLTMFLFIFIGNEIGLLPNFGVIASPTNDLNTTLGLALASSATVWAVGFKNHGVGHIKHLFKPFVPFVVVNLMEEISKPITLAFRLFGNILAGEILLEILYYLAPIGAPLIWIIFSLVVGLIQAFIFTILTTSYLSSVVGEGH